MYLTTFKLTIKTLEWRHFMSFDVFIVDYKNSEAYQFTAIWYNFEHILTNIYLFKVHKRNILEQDVKFVQN